MSASAPYVDCSVVVVVDSSVVFSCDVRSWRGPDGDGATRHVAAVTTDNVSCCGMYICKRSLRPLMPHLADNGDHAGLSVNDGSIWYAILAGAGRVKA